MFVEKFTRVMRGYDPEEVNAFIDGVINQVEKIINDQKRQEQTVKTQKAEIEDLKAKLEKYEKLEMTLSTAVINAQDSSENIRRVARQEGDMIVENARKNANRIINDALMRAQKTEYDASLLRKNITLFKNKLRMMLQNQMEMVDEMDKEEL